MALLSFCWVFCDIRLILGSNGCCWVVALMKEAFLFLAASLRFDLPLLCLPVVEIILWFIISPWKSSPILIDWLALSTLSRMSLKVVYWTWGSSVLFGCAMTE